MNDGETMMSNHEANHITTETYAAQTVYRDDKVATQYDRRRFTSLRGRFGDWLDKRALAAALAYLPQEDGIILDVPCGTGRITSYVADAGYKVVAADISAEMIAVAQDRLIGSPVPPLGYAQADAVRLPFRSDAFICTTAMRFMGHIPSATRVQILRELARVSRGNIIADFCVSHLITNMRRRVERLLGTRDLGFKGGSTWRVVARDQLEREFRAADLEAVRWIPKARFLSDGWTVLLARKGAAVRTRLERST